MVASRFILFYIAMMNTFNPSHRQGDQLNYHHKSLTYHTSRIIYELLNLQALNMSSESLNQRMKIGMGSINNEADDSFDEKCEPVSSYFLS